MPKEIRRLEGEKRLINVVSIHSRANISNDERNNEEAE